MAYAEDLLELARSQLGVKESPAGTNRVKYNTEYYGRAVAGDDYPWCCVFQWWLFRQAGAAELFYGGGKTASCTALYSWYRKRGQTVGKNGIRPGDLVFFNFDGNQDGVMNHIGLCECVEPRYVTTIDGNTGTASEANGGAVMRRRRALKYVGGAARPEYEEDGEMTQERFEEMLAAAVERRRYRYAQEVPEWARATVRKGLLNGYIRMDGEGAMNVAAWELPNLVRMDRAGLLDAPAGEA